MTITKSFHPLSYWNPSILCLRLIATFHDYEIWQIDVKIVFLNRYLEKDSIWSYFWVSHSVIVIIRSASYKGRYMDSSKHLEVRILALMMWSKCLISSKIRRSHVCTKGQWEHCHISRIISRWHLPDWEWYFHVDIGQIIVIKKIYRERPRRSFLHSWYKSL